MITELTKEQEAKIKDYIDLGLQIGLRTKPINKTKAMETVKYLYKLAKETEPKEIVFVSSPKAANEEIRRRLNTKSNYSSDLSNLHISYYVDYLFRGKEVVCKEKNATKEAFEITEKNEEFIKQVSEIHEIYMFDTIAIVSDFPEEINMVNGRLHKDQGASIRYRDGFSVYTLNGIQVSKEIAYLKPENITKDLIIKETNADIRREIIRKLTSEQLVTVLDAQVIDTKTYDFTKKKVVRKFIKKKVGRKTVKKLVTRTKKETVKLTYELLNININGDRVRPFLKMTNPSLKNVVHVEGVSPEVRTVEQALMFRNGLSSFELPVKIS